MGLIGSQIAYGLGTANYKSNGNHELDMKIIGDTVTAIRAGYAHLDGAEGGCTPLVHAVASTRVDKMQGICPRY